MISVQMTTTPALTSGFLQKAVDSVLAQSYQNFEFIICEDVVTEEIKSFLKKIIQLDPRIKFIKNTQNTNSVAASLGHCLKAASSDSLYITWIFDKEILAPRALELLIHTIEKDPELDFVYGKNNSNQPDGILVRKELFDKIGWFDASVILKRESSRDLFCRMLAQAKSTMIPIYLTENYPQSSSHSSADNFPIPSTIIDKYCRLRDAASWPITVEAALHHPIDRIPQGDWSKEEITLLQYVTLEYFLNTGNIFKAYEWAKQLYKMQDGSCWGISNLATKARQSETMLSRSAHGAFAAMVYDDTKIRYLEQLHKAKEKIAEEKLVEEKIKSEQRITELQQSLRQMAQENEQIKMVLAEVQAESLDAQEQANFQREQVLSIEKLQADTERIAIELQKQLELSRIELAANRHRIVDRLNTTIKRIPWLHRILKETWKLAFK